MNIDRSKLLFRKATHHDIDLLIQYRIIFLKEIMDRNNEETEEATKIALKKYFVKSLYDDSFVAWIAEINDNPIGFGAMTIREQPGHFQVPSGKIGYILNMYTIPEYRGNKICQMILDKLIEEAKFRQLGRLDLHASPEGERVYRKYGFTEPYYKVLELKI